MMEIDALADKVRQNGYEIFWYGAASEIEIARLETALGVALPPSFVAFLGTYGGGGVVSAEISGIEQNNSALANRGTVVGDTRECRQAHALPSGLVVIYYQDDEVCWCLDGRAPGAPEWAVVSYDVFSRRVTNTIATSFIDFLSSHLELHAAPV